MTSPANEATFDERGYKKTIKVYTASKLEHGPFWREIAVIWQEVEFTARWVFRHVNENGIASWPEDCAAHGAEFWKHDYEDVVRADVVLVMGKPGDILRGALIEAGIALGLGKKVIVVGECASYGTWQYHPNVRRVKNIEAARSLLNLMRTAE